MLYGYSALARALNERLAIEPPLTDANIYAWHRRRVLNHAGMPFPEPALTLPKDKATGRSPRYQWALGPVMTWVGQGIPTYPGAGWRFPRLRGNEKPTELVTR